MGILDGVTDPQREAITHIDGPLLVVAGAGSGKTRVITKRIAYLIEQGIQPHHILAITFTNKAANEMAERVEATGAATGVWISTFHSMCARILRRNPELLNRSKNFVIFDTTDQTACVKDVMKRLEINQKDHPPEGIRNAIGRAKNDFITPEQFELQAEGFLEELVAKVYRRYEEALEANNALDFDDLLMCTARLLGDNEDFRLKWQDRFRYILIDEYQDTNRTQYLIAKHLAASGRNICATGDPDQSIYGWRGADLRNILDFEKDYPEAKVVKLEENFRSTQIILDAASAVISNNTQRIERELFTRKKGGCRLGMVVSFDEEDEGSAVAAVIKKGVRRGRRHGDFAVFYRTNAQSRAVEAALRDRSIPYKIVGAVEFYNRKEVKDILAYLRVISNPDDTVSTSRIINTPSRGIGATSVNKLRNWGDANGVSLMGSLSEASAAGVSGRSLKSVEAFAELIEGFRNQTQSPVADLVRSVIEESGYEAKLEKSKDPRADERIENIQELASAAAEYDAANPDGDLTGFLENVALISDTDALPTGAQQVSLMTIHSAKGLEFPVVMLVGMEDGLLPHAAAKDAAGGEEEERRLCYVAVTRAQEEFLFFRAESRRRYGRVDCFPPSPFLDEIPAELFDRPDDMLDPDDDDDDLLIEDDQCDELPSDEPESQVIEPLTRGDFVKHSKFGRGRVLSVSGSGDNTMARVSFPEGEKSLMLKFARLDRVG